MIISVKIGDLDSREISAWKHPDLASRLKSEHSLIEIVCYIINGIIFRQMKTASWASLNHVHCKKKSWIIKNTKTSVLRSWIASRRTKNQTTFSMRGYESFLMMFAFSAVTRCQLSGSYTYGNNNAQVSAAETRGLRKQWRREVCFYLLFWPPLMSASENRDSLGMKDLGQLIYSYSCFITDIVLP